LIANSVFPERDTISPAPSRKNCRAVVQYNFLFPGFPHCRHSTGGFVHLGITITEDSSSFTPRNAAPTELTRTWRGASSTTLITIVAGAWAMIRRYQMGGIGLFGGRTER